MKIGDTVIGLNVPDTIPCRIGKVGRIIDRSSTGLWVVEWRPGDTNGMLDEELDVLRPVVAG